MMTHNCGWSAAMARARTGEQLLDAYDDELRNRYGVALAEIEDIVEDSDIAWNDGDFIPGEDEGGVNEDDTDTT